MAIGRGDTQMRKLSFITFSYFAHIGCIIPFLSWHMKEMGFSLKESADLNGMDAILSIILTTIITYIVECTKRHRSAGVILVFTGALAFVALAFIPGFDKLKYKPLADFNCDSGLRVERCVNWQTCSDAFEDSDNLTKISLSDCHYQCQHFPPSDPLHLCFQGDGGSMCVVFDEDIRDFPVEFVTHLQSWPHVETDLESDVALMRANISKSRARAKMCNYLPIIPVNYNSKQYKNISCRPSILGCTVYCKAMFWSGEEEISPYQCEEAFGNPVTSYWGYCILRAIGDTCILSVVCIIHGMIIWGSLDYEDTFSRTHIWAALALAIMAPLSGCLLDYFTDMDGRVDLSPSTFLAAGWALLTCTLLIILPIEQRRSVGDNLPKFGILKKYPSQFMEFFIVLFLIIPVLGTQWGVLFNYLPWLMEGLGVTQMQMGLSYTLTFAFSVPFLFITKNMVRSIGAVNLAVFACFFYFTAFAGLPFISNPWWILPFSLMGSFSLCVMWITTGANIHRLSAMLLKPSFTSHLQYILNMIHFGAGRFVAAFCGAIIIQTYNVKTAFCGVAVFSAVFGFLLILVYHGCIRRKRSHPIASSKRGPWLPLEDRGKNGFVKGHAPIATDMEDDADASPPFKNALNNNSH